MQKTPSPQSASKSGGAQRPHATQRQTPAPHHPVADGPLTQGFNAHGNAHSVHPSHLNLLALQRAVGNRAVGRLIQAKFTISRPHDPDEHEADQVADRVMRMPEPGAPENTDTPMQPKPLLPRITPLVQRETEVHEEEAIAAQDALQRALGDGTENEEEDVATKPFIQRQAMEEEEAGQAKGLPGQFPRQVGSTFPPISGSLGARLQRVCSACEEKKRRRPEEEEGLVQTNPIVCHQCGAKEPLVQPKGGPSPTPHVSSTVAANIHALEGGGKPLPQATRALFEPRFGADFSHIRVHTDSRSAATAQSINARAFTVGADIAFAEGEYRPDTTTGKYLLAHELAHASLGHPGVKRAPEPCIAPSPVQTQRPIFVDGVQIVDDEAFMYCQLRERASVKGMDEPTDRFFPLLRADYAAARDFARQFEANPTGFGDRTPRSEAELDTESRVIYLMPGLLAALDREWHGFVEEFEDSAKRFAEETLAHSEVEERAAAFRYGIDWTTLSPYPGTDIFFPALQLDVDVYSMRATPDVAELQAAAAILLKRRQAVDQAKDAVTAASDAYAEAVQNENPNEVTFAHQYYAAEREHAARVDEYSLVLGYLGEQHPILKAFGDPGRDIDDLEELTKPQAATEMALMLGKEIVSRLRNIQKVREGLKDRDKVNIWRLPDLVEITKVRLGAETDPLKQQWIKNQVSVEKPGLLEPIALLIFNIAALLLAAPTGGISLAVAAGVNAAVAVQHVKDYMLQKALTGTSFDKAKALSQDEPSLFWLAVDIVGVAFDAAAAFKALSGTVKAIKAANEVRDTVKVATELEKLKAAAQQIGGEDLWTRIAAHLGEAATEDRAALKALGLAEDEIKSLRTGVELSEQELKAGTLSGKAAEGTGKVSRSGHIFSCASPCVWMREKYASILGPEVIVEGEAASLRKQFLALEEGAAKVAEEVRIAEANLQVAKQTERAAAEEALKRAKSAAEVVEKNVAAFDAKLAKEVNYRVTIQKFGELGPVEANKLRTLTADGIKRIGELDPEAAKRLLQLAPDSLSKLTSLSPRNLNKLAQFEKETVQMFVQLDVDALAYVADLNVAALEWLSKLKPSAVAKIASARVRSPFSLRRLVEKIGPKSSSREIDKALAKAERHRAQLEKAFKATKSGDWSKIRGKDRSSIGRHIGYELEEMVRATAVGGRAKTVLNYDLVNKKLIGKLQKDGGRAVITQGRLKGGDLRFDIAEIDFDQKTVELIDLVPKADAAHIAGTKLYEKELRKLLPGDFEFLTKEHRYVGKEGQVLDVLEEAVLTK
jgi:hypothetical protein